MSILVEIPKRPDGPPKAADFDEKRFFVYEACERVFLRDSVAHEHAVAKRAVEALRAIKRGNPYAEGQLAREALRDIDESGWTP